MEVGRHQAGVSWIHARPRIDLFAVMLWARPSEEDMRALVLSLVLELDAETIPAHRSLVDASRLEGADLGAFAVLNGYVREHHALLSRQVMKLALVRPTGMEGAVVAGFFQVLQAPYPVELFEDAADALAWLGEDRSLASQLAELTAEVSGAAPIIIALRSYLSANLSASIDEAADHLALSPRTLQRQLKQAETTFQQEVITVKLAEAERRMLDSDAPLTAIALDSGFATLQHFSAAFRKLRGMSPSEWRAKRAR